MWHCELMLPPLPLVAEQSNAFLLLGVIWLSIVLTGAGLTWHAAEKI